MLSNATEVLYKPMINLQYKLNNTRCARLSKRETNNKIVCDLPRWKIIDFI